MPQIVAWKCPHTGSIFESKQKYNGHLRSLGRARAYERKIRNRDAELDARLRGIQKSVRSFAELEEAIVQNSDLILALAAKYNPSITTAHGRIKKQFADARIVQVKFTEMHWEDCASNSHSCPRNGVTNWGGRTMLEDGTPAPRGYPGWKGRITFKDQANSDFMFGVSWFKKTQIHTGTGGGRGNCSFSYQVELFASDWPGLAEQRNDAILEATLLNVKHKMADDQLSFKDPRDV